LKWVNSNSDPFYIKTGAIIYKINNDTITEFTSSSDKIWYIDDDNNYWYLSGDNSDKIYKYMPEELIKHFLFNQ